MLEIDRVQGATRVQRAARDMIDARRQHQRRTVAAIMRQTRLTMQGGSAAAARDSRAARQLTASEMTSAAPAHVGLALDQSFSALGLRGSGSLEDRLAELQRMVAAERERIVALASEEPLALRPSSGTGVVREGLNSSPTARMPASVRHLHPSGLPMSPAAALSPAADSPNGSKLRSFPGLSPGRVSGLSASVLEFTRLEHECGVSPIIKEGRERLHAVIDELAPQSEDREDDDRMAGGAVKSRAGDQGARVTTAGIPEPRRYGDPASPADAAMPRPDTAGLRVDGCAVVYVQASRTHSVAPPGCESRAVGGGGVTDAGTTGWMASGLPAGSHAMQPAVRNAAAEMVAGAHPRLSDNHTLSAILGFLDQSENSAGVGGKTGGRTRFVDSSDDIARCRGASQHGACIVDDVEDISWCLNHSKNGCLNGSKNNAHVLDESENKPPPNQAFPHGTVTESAPTKSPLHQDGRRDPSAGDGGAAKASCARASGEAQPAAARETCRPQSEPCELPDLSGVPRSLSAFLQSQDAPPLPADASATALATNRASTGAPTSAVPAARPVLRSASAICAPTGGWDGSTCVSFDVSSSPPSSKAPQARGAALAETVYVGVKQKMGAMKAEMQALRERNGELQASEVPTRLTLPRPSGSTHQGLAGPAPAHIRPLKARLQSLDVLTSFSPSFRPRPFRPAPPPPLPPSSSGSFAGQGVRPLGRPRRRPSPSPSGCRRRKVVWGRNGGPAPAVHRPAVGRQSGAEQTVRGYGGAAAWDGGAARGGRGQAGGRLREGDEEAEGDVGGG